jgi:uncharacterized protein YkwD
MRRRLLGLVPLVAAGCVGLGHPSSTTVSPEAPRAAYYNAGEAIPDLGAFERDLLARVQAFLERRRRQALTLDPALCRVGREYTRAALRSEGRPHAALIDYLLHHAGVTEPHPLLFHAAFPVESADGFAARLERQLPRLLEQPVTEMGISALRVGRTVGVTLVLLHRVARLEALPQRAARGAVVPVRGRIPAGYREPTLLATTPTGQTRQQALEVAAGRFEGRLALDDGPGTYTVEILASGPLGPSVVSLFPIYCDVEPPARFVAPAPGVATPDDAREAEVLFVRLINDERRRRGLAPLQHNRRLSELARDHSRDMREAGYVGHRSPRTGLLTDRLKHAGIPASVSLENIARNDSVAGAHQGLMSSPGHRRNLLDPRVRELGVGVVFQGEGAARQIYVTQNFILPIVLVDPRLTRLDLWRRAQERRARSGLPALRREPLLEELAARAAERILDRGRLEGDGEAMLAEEVKRLGLPFRSVRAHLFVARGVGETLDAQTWTRAGHYRAGIGVAQRPTSAFGDYALCVVLLLAEEHDRAPGDGR